MCNKIRVGILVMKGIDIKSDNFIFMVNRF